MNRNTRVVLSGLAGALALAQVARAQTRPYIGFVYPAGGQQGTTCRIRLGGQGLDDVTGALVSGTGVTARVTECCRRFNNQETDLLREQLKALKQTNSVGAAMPTMTMAMEPSMMGMMAAEPGAGVSAKSGLVARLEKRLADYVSTPACMSIATLVMVEIVIAPEAAPGEREIRLVTRRGISNPLGFHVGQVPEFTRKPMRTSELHVLGKEAASLRKRPPDEVEDRITLPCTVNGQIAPGEANRYRFQVRKGQRLVLSTRARELVPYVADAVPGWFQPVLVLYDARGREVAYSDHYQYRPDPVIFYEAPEDGEYVFAIYDSIYRGREDFVYRVTIGELPFVTGIFPLGGRTGEVATLTVDGWNLGQTGPMVLPGYALPGVYPVVVKRNGLVSNVQPFASDTLPECGVGKPNRDLAHARQVKLPVVINGRIDQPGAWSVFRFAGKSNETVVAEVLARRLDSPLDSVVKLTDGQGRVLALNDDHEDLESGLKTHHADSYLMTRLPADGNYYVHLGDVAGNAGAAYAYRLRLGPPQPDFALRVVPSGATLRSKGSTSLTVYAIRKDGFTGPIKVTVKDAPPGFSASTNTLTGTQTVAQLTLKTSLSNTVQAVDLVVAGRDRIEGKDVTRDAVPAEDRMQAFLWRHLVPATMLKAMVYDPNGEPPPGRVPPVCPPSAAAGKVTPVSNAVSGVTVALASNSVSGAGSSTNRQAAVSPPKFTRQQVASRIRDLKTLYGEGFLTDDFYLAKMAECEAVP